MQEIEETGGLGDRAAPRNRERHILLTGSTNFLGSTILKEPLQDPTVATVHCIAVPPDSWKHIPQMTSSKVVIYQGALNSPNLGRIDSEWETIQDRTDSTIHAGANGHCLNNYHSLVVPNVYSTIRLARLAIQRRIPCTLVRRTAYLYSLVVQPSLHFRWPTFSRARMVPRDQRACVRQRN